MTFPMGEIDPNTVRPGWVALLIVLALAGATVLLWRNMGKQLKKIDFDQPGRAAAPREPAGPGDRDGQAGAAAVPAPADAADRPGDKLGDQPGEQVPQGPGKTQG